MRSATPARSVSTLKGRIASVIKRPHVVQA
jgi:hypothetical protein